VLEDPPKTPLRRSKALRTRRRRFHGLPNVLEALKVA